MYMYKCIAVCSDVIYMYIDVRVIKHVHIYHIYIHDYIYIEWYIRGPIEHTVNAGVPAGVPAVGPCGGGGTLRGRLKIFN